MPGICDIPQITIVCEAGGEAVDAATSNFIEQAAKAFSDAVGKLAQILLTFWTDVNLPESVAAPDGPVQFIRDSTSYISMAVLVMSLLITGAKLAIQQKAEPGIDAAKGIVQYIVYATSGLPLILVLGSAGDSFSSWILDRASGGNVGAIFTGIFTVSALGPLGPGLVLVVALLAILSALGQMALMMIRIGMLVGLAGILPVTAAAAVSKGGKAGLGKVSGWLIAWLLYKPAAAVVYATAFALVGHGKDLVSVLSGLFLMVLSILALPALLRLLVPATEAMAATSGSGAAAGIAAGGAVATGAIQMRSMTASSSTSKGSGSGGGTGFSSPSGSGGSVGLGTSGPGGAGRQSQSAPPGAKQSTGATGGGPGAATAGAKAGPVGAAVGAGATAVGQGVQAARNLGDQAAGGPTGAGEGK